MKYKTSKIRNQESSGFFKSLMQINLLIGLLFSVHLIKLANCETKEFDWGELGVSLASPKHNLGNLLGGGGSGVANNLRILVSPQRRVSKR